MFQFSLLFEILLKHIFNTNKVKEILASCLFQVFQGLRGCLDRKGTEETEASIHLLNF